MGPSERYPVTSFVAGMAVLLPAVYLARASSYADWIWGEDSKWHLPVFGLGVILVTCLVQVVVLVLRGRIEMMRKKRFIK